MTLPTHTPAKNPFPLPHASLAEAIAKKIDVTAPFPPHMKESFKALGIEIKK